MHATPPAAFPSAAKKDEIPADVLPLMESAREFVRAQQMNPVEKRSEASRLLDAIGNVPSAFEPGLEPHEKTTREGRRRELWAQYHAFRELAGEDHLTPERRAMLLERARKELPRLARYSAALGIVEDIEAEHDVEESFARRKLKEWRDDSREVVTDYLSEALSGEQIRFLSGFHGRAFRRIRFRVVFTDDYPRRTLLVDVPVRAPYVLQDFQDSVKHAATLKKIKALLAIWDVSFRVERREIGAVVVADGFEIHPAQ
jgi:hypothetical protein